MPTSDNELEEEGQPELYTPPPGQNVDLDQSPPVVPRDYPMGVTEYGTTAAEERIDEPIAQRAAREEPEVDEYDVDTHDDEPLAGRLLEPDSDVDEIDRTPEAVALLAEDDSAGMSAEELAMHIVGDDEASDTSPAEERSEYLKR